MVDGGNGAVWPAQLAAGHAQAVEGLGAGDLVNEVEVDVEDGGLVSGRDDEMLLPDLFKHGARRGVGGFGHCGLLGRAGASLVGEARPPPGTGILCGVPSGSTRMASRIFCTMAVPGTGCRTQRATERSRGWGRW